MRRFASVAAAIAIGLTVACTSALSNHAAKGPTLNEDIDAQIAKDDAIVWALRRPLAWADFKGPAPAEVGAVAAQTNYALLHGAGCTGSKFEFRVVAAFVPDKSWVRTSMLRSPAESVRALRHEQTHFDIAEVYARRMRQRFAEVYNPCGTSREALDTIANRYITDEAGAQARYDDETRHGLTVARQRQWDADVKRMLSGSD